MISPPARRNKSEKRTNGVKKNDPPGWNFSSSFSNLNKTDYLQTSFSHDTGAFFLVALTMSNTAEVKTINYKWIFWPQDSLSVTVVIILANFDHLHANMLCRLL